jgi:mitochondrial fission protein ELM1
MRKDADKLHQAVALAARLAIKLPVTQNIAAMMAKIPPTPATNTGTTKNSTL